MSGGNDPATLREAARLVDEMGDRTRDQRCRCGICRQRIELCDELATYLRMRAIQTEQAAEKAARAELEKAGE